ncbi:MAG: ATP-dependent helicase [Candidatus Aminicenantes bacterium]|nr:ATP-dependent helicase [Candidatus Aminicenantes bacterium]
MSKIPTNEQNIIINEKSGRFAVRACPGSGKTFSVAARLNRFLKKWEHAHQGIATISFTNVAWKEIEKYLQSDFGVEFPGYPHFLRTIDSFINTYIFLPFAHLVMGCQERPVLCGPPIDNYEPIGHPPYFWNSYQCYRRCKLNDFSFNSNDEFIKIKKNTVITECRYNQHMPCLTYKKRFNESGYATQHDANYFALQVVKKYPSIAEALAIRFPVIMIDEAQDTSSVQMEIINSLINKGLKELMLIGDPDQAIYEWRTAEPALFIQKFEEWVDNSTELHENKRSSQKICDFVSVISSYENMSASNEEVAAFEQAPEIWEYQNEDELQELKEKFIEHCKELGIKEKDIAILTRGREILNKIVAGTETTYGISPWKDGSDEDKRLSYLTIGLAKSRYLYDKGNYKNALKYLEREYWKWLYNQSICKPSDLREKYEEVGLSNWRSDLFEMIVSMPKSDCSLSQWILDANNKIQSFDNLKNVELKIKRNSRSCNYSNLTFDETFGRKQLSSNVDECFLGTVHSAKGETFEAVMLVIKKNDGNRKKYSNTLEENIKDYEELRIIYVGMTRPCRVLVLVVPSQSVNIWKTKFNIK